MKDESLRERLMKVLALARQGVGGEKENAEVLLAKLLRQHGLTLADLEDIDGDGPRESWYVRVRDARERSLFVGLVNRVCGRKRSVWQEKKNQWRLSVEVTRGERVELELSWEVIGKAWGETVEDLLLAFMYRNALYDPADPGEEKRELSAEAKARQRRAAAMAIGIDRTELPRKRLTSGGARRSVPS